MKQEAKKTAIITGSGRGIGKEIAIILAKKSVNVVVCSRTQSEINSTVAESLALEVSEHQNIRVLTLFLGEVATKMWQEYDFNYYQKNKSKMLQPRRFI